jgi:hypothetical protein
MRRRHLLAKGGTHEIIVPRGPNGQPGERLLSPTPSLYRPRVVGCGSREDFRLLLDLQGTTLASVCLGTVAERGDPEESVHRTLERRAFHGYGRDSPIVAERIVGEEALRYRLVFGTGVLTEWKFSHRGWLFVVGVLDRGPDPAATVARAREVLSTWHWLDVAS